MSLQGIFVSSVIQLFIVAGALALILPFIRDKRVYYYASLSSIGFSFASSVALLFLELKGGGAGKYVYLADWPSLGFSISFIMDPLSSIMMSLVSGLSLVIGIYSVYYMRKEYGFNRFFVFYTFFVASMMLVVSANNLLLLFIGWEGTGLCSYALIGHWYRDEEEHYVGDPGRTVLGTPMYSSPSMSGLRAILFTRVPDILMLTALLGILLYSGTLDYSALLSRSDGLLSKLYSAGLLRILLFFLFVGPMAKSAQFPLHEWLVTAMTGPTPVSALIHAATMVKAGVYFMLRITPLFYSGANKLLLSNSIYSGGVLSSIHSAYLFVGAVGALTAFSLATMAVVAREAKLILAYSTASQLGYMFLGIGASVFTGEPGVLLFFVLMHLVAHAIFKAGLFLGAGVLIHEGGSRFIDEWPRFSRGLRLTLSYMWILVLSLAGMPPLIGFWTKDSLVEGVFSAGLYILGTIGLVTVFLTAYYGSRLLLYSGKYGRGESELSEPPLLMSSTYGLLAVLSVVLGVVWPLIFADSLGFLSSSFLEPPSISHAVSGMEMHLSLFSLSLLGAGLLVSYYGYVGGLDTRRISSSLKPLTLFLYDRWLLNPLYYKFATLIVLPLAGLTYRYLERGLDFFYHNLLPWSTGLSSKALDRLHNGDLLRYLLFFALGVLLVLLLLVGGAW